MCYQSLNKLPQQRILACAMKPVPAALTCLIACSASVAQQQQKRAAQPSATTTVSGRVFCADTNAPARMTTVVLQPAEAIDSLAAGEQKAITSSGEAAQTLLDGSFILHHVEPGSYYVIALQTGYVSPLASLSIPSPDDPAFRNKTPKKIPLAAPRITVQANLPVAVNVTIERGSSISGTVQYDDGSPAIGIQLNLLTHGKDPGWTTVTSYEPVGRSSFFEQTDGEGHYHFSGLPAGRYLLQATLQLSTMTYTRNEHGGSSGSSSNAYSLDLYPGGVTRPKDAEPIALSPGEERKGLDMQIPISRLHTVRGNIIAAHDGHVVNGGSLSLSYSDDKSRAGFAALSPDDDTFNFAFVLEGDYILRVWGASDDEYREIRNPPNSSPPTRTESRSVRQYGNAEQRIHVTSDLSSVTIAVPDVPQQKPQPWQ